MPVKVSAILSVILFLLMMPISADISDASSVTEESIRVQVTNIYGSEFISPGTLDEGEHGNSGIYFFIEGSERHDMFLKYLDGNLKIIPNDDYMVIEEGSHVHAYFFDRNSYQEWHTLVTFQAPDGDFRFKSISFTIERPIDRISFFFQSGSTASIEWSNRTPIAVTAFFNGIELKSNQIDIDIDRNGAYSLEFVLVSDLDDSIVTTVSYTVSGFDDSNSMPLGMVMWVAFLIVIAAILLLRAGPKWSKNKHQG